MSRSFHVTRQRIVREIVLVRGKDRMEAILAGARGEGEVIDSTETVICLSAEETIHSQRRRHAQPPPASAAVPDQGEGDGEGVMGDELLGGNAGIHEPPASTPTTGYTLTPPQEHPPCRRALDPANDPLPDPGRLQPGDTVQPGDEYRLRLGEPWELVPRSLVGHAISRAAAAQFRRPV